MSPSGMRWPTATGGRSRDGIEVSSEIMNQILQMIENEVNSRPSATEYEMAYHLRVASRPNPLCDQANGSILPQDGSCPGNWDSVT